MSAPRDVCCICYEEFDDLSSSQIAGRIAAGRSLFWPCGHRVHVECINQSEAGLRSAAEKCFQCRTAADPEVRVSLLRLAAAAPPPAAASHVPAEVPLVPPRAVHIPNVAALCCPRLLHADGSFTELLDDRRMTYMGLDGDTGSMQWSCLRCNRQVSLPNMPLLQADQGVCHEHGTMCYVMDCRSDVPFWSCMDHRENQNDVPFPISHMRIVGNALQPILITSSDEGEGTLTPMSLSSLFSEEALAAMAADSNMESNEVIVTPVLMDDVLDRLSAIQSRYGTDEETRRIETMLERYD